MMKIEVLGMQDMDDGSSLMTVDMDREALVALAKVGLLKALTDATADVLKDDQEPDMKVSQAEDMFLKQMAKDLDSLSVEASTLRGRYRNGEAFQDYQVRDMTDMEMDAEAMDRVLQYYRGSNWRHNS